MIVLNQRFLKLPQRDEFALAWNQRIANTGRTLTALEYNANMRLARRSDVHGWRDSVSILAVGWGDEDANSILWDSDEVAIVDGANSYEAGFTDLAADGYFLPNWIPSVLGIAGMGCYRHNPTGDVVSDMGSGDGTNLWEMVIRWSDNDSDIRYGNSVASAISVAGPTTSGLITMHRESETVQLYDHQTPTVNTELSAAAISGADQIPTEKVACGGLNDQGTVVNHSGGFYGCFFYIKTALTPTQLAHLKADLTQWLVDLDWIPKVVFSAEDGEDGNLVCSWTRHALPTPDTQTVEYSLDGESGWTTVEEVPGESAEITINNPALSRYYRIVFYNSAYGQCISNVVGPITVTGDTDGAAWDGRLAVSLGQSDSRRTTLMDLITLGRENGWYDKVLDFGLIGFGNASANRVSAKSASLTQCTFEGTNAHEVGGVQMGADGAMHTGYLVGSAGWTATEQVLLAGIKSSVDGFFIGANNSGARSAISHDSAYHGTYIHSFASTNVGIIASKRNGSDVRTIKITSGGGLSVLATSAGAAGGSIAGAMGVRVGAEGGAGDIAENFSEPDCYAWLLGVEMTDVQFDSMALDFFQAAIDLGWSPL